MNTLLLDVATWDLTADASGNIALATDPYSAAQDVASACRLYAGELWYDTTQGVPYSTQVLGTLPPLAFVKAQLVAAALSVPTVTAATVTVTGFADRNLTGQVQFVTSTTTGTVGFGGALPWWVNAAATASAPSPSGSGPWNYQFGPQFGSGA